MLRYIYAAAFCCLSFAMSFSSANADMSADSPSARARDFAVFSATHPVRGFTIYQAERDSTDPRVLFGGTVSTGFFGEFYVYGGPENPFGILENAFGGPVAGIYQLRSGNSPRLLLRNIFERLINLHIVGEEGDKVYLAADYYLRNGLTRTGIIETDGTVDGTRLLLNVWDWDNPRPNAPAISAGGIVSVFRMNDRLMMLTNGLTGQWTQTGLTAGVMYDLDVEAGRARIAFRFPNDGGYIFYNSTVQRGLGTRTAVVGPSGDEKLVFWRANRNGVRPWVSDGTRIGTVDLQPLNARSGSGLVNYFVRLGDEILFTAENRASGYELWGTDGTRANTRMIRDLLPGDFGSGPDLERSVRYGNQLIFPAQGADSRWELWRTDGTRSGSRKIGLRHQGRVVQPSYDGLQTMALQGDWLYFGGWKQSGNCPFGPSIGEAGVCTLTSGLYRYNLRSDRLQLVETTSDLGCIFNSGGLSIAYVGAAHTSVMSFGDRVAFNASGLSQSGPMQSCSDVEFDNEPWVLDRQGARKWFDIARRDTSSDPVFLGSSLCQGRC